MKRTIPIIFFALVGCAQDGRDGLAGVPGRDGKDGSMGDSGSIGQKGPILWQMICGLKYSYSTHNFRYVKAPHSSNGKDIRFSI